MVPRNSNSIVYCVLWRTGHTMVERRTGHTLVYRVYVGSLAGVLIKRFLRYAFPFSCSFFFPSISFAPSVAFARFFVLFFVFFFSFFASSFIPFVTFVPFSVFLTLGFPFMTASFSTRHCVCSGHEYHRQETWWDIRKSRTRKAKSWNDLSINQKLPKLHPTADVRTSLVSFPSWPYPLFSVSSLKGRVLHPYHFARNIERQPLPMMIISSY